MPKVDERLRHVTLKVERAYDHISALEQQLRAFLESHPYKVGEKRDPKTRKLIYFVESAEPVPDCLPLIAGDAIQNLMSALDHLAYQIVCSDTGDNPPNPGGIYFPIADERAKYEHKRRRKMVGACQQTFDAFDALKPYKGGNDQLWALHRLNNIEKHRLLLTVGSQAGGMHLSQLMVSANLPSKLVDAVERTNLYLNPAEKGFPLTAGFELYIGAVDENPNPKARFRFDVALSEAGVIEGKPVLEVINQFAKVVDDTVAALTPLLK